VKSVSQQEYVRRFKIGLSAEFELLHKLEELGFAVWHLRSSGDLLLRIGISNYVIDVKMVSTSYRGKTPYNRVYFRKEGTKKMLTLARCFDFQPVIALKYKDEWFVSGAFPTFNHVKKHGTTSTFESLDPIPLKSLLTIMS
jgi:Holliday junction resolvase